MTPINKPIAPDSLVVVEKILIVISATLIIRLVFLATRKIERSKGNGTFYQLLMLVDDAKWFTFLHLNSAFKQIELAEECRSIKIFGFHNGL